MYRFTIRSLLLSQFLFSLTVIGYDASAATWRFTSCTGVPNGVPCTQIAANSISDLCRVQLNLRPDKFLKLKKIWVYDPNPISMRAYCFYEYQLAGSVGEFVNHASASNEGCPAGQMFDSETLGCIDLSKPPCRAGNPIDIYDGNKVEESEDYKYSGLNGEIKVLRFYSGKNNHLSNYNAENDSYVGKWRFSFTDKLYFSDFEYGSGVHSVNSQIVTFKDPKNRDLIFRSTDGLSWVSKSGSAEFLHHYFTSNGDKQWIIKFSSGDIKKFDNLGRLIGENIKNGHTLTIDYSSSPGWSQDLWDTMIIKNNNIPLFEYKIKRSPFAYSSSSQEDVVSIKVPSGETLMYQYDSIGNLIKIEYLLAGKNKEIHYEDPIFKKYMTGLTDENNVRYATWKYDAQGRAISSEHAGGAEKTLLAFNADGSTTVTNALNKKTIYRFDDIAGARRVVKVEGQATASCAGANQDYTYTPEGWIASKTDWKGIKTTYQYNALGQETSRTEAFGTTEARTITTEWHPTLFVKTKVTEPGKQTVYSYDTQGRLLNQSAQPLTVQ